MKEFINDILNWLRDTSYNASPERAEWAAKRLAGHRAYMTGYKRTNPYLDPDAWMDE